jgi:glycerol-3-phosphate dehydrogenase (NAD(P)+)
MSEAVAVIGAGAWGTALAVRLAEGGARVRLWARDPALAEAMAVARENRARLPGVALPPGVLPTAHLAEAVDRARVVLLAVPVAPLRGLARLLAGCWPGAVPALVCAKGFEAAGHALPHEVLAACLPGVPLGVLTGPNFAAEVAAGLPAAAVLAGAQAPLSMPRLRLYASDDMVGAAVGGALKNVIAIAAGVVIGAGLGENARAAIITRGLAETARLAVALGGRAETVSGLSGMGDLVLTCTGAKSRNYSLGVALGQGRALGSILAGRTMATEGVGTAPAAVARARMAGVELPVSAAVAALLAGEASVAELAARLLARPVGEE